MEAWCGSSLQCSRQTHWRGEYNRFNLGLSAKICADLRGFRTNPRKYIPRSVVLRAFAGRRLGPGSLGEVAGTIVQLEVLVLQGRVYDLDLDLAV